MPASANAGSITDGRNNGYNTRKYAKSFECGQSRLGVSLVPYYRLKEVVGIEVNPLLFQNRATANEQWL